MLQVKKMDKSQIIFSVLFICQVPWTVRCDFTSVNYYSKDLNFQVPSSAREENFVIVSTPSSDVFSKNFYFNYINCNLASSQCEVGQDCFNCPRSYEPKKCHIDLPRNYSLPLRQVDLKTFGDYGENVIVDWASKAVINETSDYPNTRKIQLVSMANCFVQDISIELSSADNGMRRIVLDSLPTFKSFDVFYIDYRVCSDSGWLRMKYNEDGKAHEQPECILGLEKSNRKFSMDVVMGSDMNEIIMDRNKDNWMLYELKNHSNHVTEFHRGTNDEGDLFDIGRLAVHSDKFGSLCWLPDIELSYDLNCTIFRAEPKYVKSLSLNFPYKVRDFELKMIDFKRIYVLTSSSDDTSCTYDLWIFDINGLRIDGPLRIQGPRCVFTHRLEPRPLITQLNRDKICINFVFQRSTHGGSSYRPKMDLAQDKQFTVMTECFLHSN